MYDVGGWRLASRPNLRDGLEDDTHVQVSNVCRFRQGKNRLQARRFFSNTFASEEIDEKRNVCPVVIPICDLRISGRRLTYIIRHSKRHLKAGLPMLIWAVLV